MLLKESKTSGYSFENSGISHILVGIKTQSSSRLRYTFQSLVTPPATPVWEERSSIQLGSYFKKKIVIRSQISYDCFFSIYPKIKKN